MKVSLLFLTFFVFTQSLFGFSPVPVDEYYQSVIWLSGDSLKTALHELINGHVMYPYFSDSTVATKDIMIEADADLSHPGNIILFYSGRSQKVEYADHGDNFDYMIEYGISHVDSWNREHIWAKSHGFPDMADTAYTDVHHLRPADRSVNGARGNRDFDWGGYSLDEVEGCYYDFDSWEPPDRVKGDVARMMFYMATRYEGENKTYDLELLDKTGTYGPKFGKLSTLLQWHELDPVDERERHRNEVIYSYQHNRNPYIDHPEFIALIWGEPVIESVLNYSDPIIGFGNQVIDVFSNLKPFVVSGTNLTGKVVLTARSPFYIADNQDKAPRNELQFSPQNGFLNQEIIIYFKPDQKIYYEDTLFMNTQGSETVHVILKGHGIDPLAEVLLYSSFEKGTDGWTTYSIAGNEDWYHSSYGDRHFMKMSGYKADEPCIDWLISPKMNLQNYKNIILSFETAKNHTDITPGLEVFISMDYVERNNPKNCNWHALSALLSQGHYEWKHSGYIDISEFTASYVHIAFKYTNSSPSKATSWEVDDVEVIGVENK
jgi:endonuclease I